MNLGKACRSMCSTHGLSEDPGPHAVFFSSVRRAGRGVGSRVWSSSSSSSSPPAFDTVDTVDNVKSVDSVDNVNSVDSVEVSTVSTKKQQDASKNHKNPRCPYLILGKVYFCRGKSFAPSQKKT